MCLRVQDLHAHVVHTVQQKLAVGGTALHCNVVARSLGRKRVEFRVQASEFRV